MRSDVLPETVLIGNSAGLMLTWLKGSFTCSVNKTDSKSSSDQSAMLLVFVYTALHFHTPAVLAVGDTEASGELYLFIYLFLITSWKLFTTAETCGKNYNWYKFSCGWRFVLHLLLSKKLLLQFNTHVLHGICLRFSTPHTSIYLL